MTNNVVPVAVVAADCHIEELIWRDRPGVTHDAFYGFSQVVDIALERQLPLILAGDVVETLPQDSPTTKTIVHIREQMHRLRDAGIPVYAIKGQHDTAFPSWLSAISGMKCDMGGACANISGLNFYFLDYTSHINLTDAIQYMPSNTDIFVAHQCWYEFMGGPASDGKLLDVPHVKMCISGDYHRPVCKVVMRDNNRPVTLLSPGATHMRKINEPTAHYAWIINSDFSATQIGLKSRLVIRSEPNTVGDIDSTLEELDALIATVAEMADTLPPELRKPLWHIIDGTEETNTYSRIVSACQDRATIIYAKSKVGNAEETAPDRHYSVNDSTSILIPLKDECGQDDAVYDLLSKLLTSPDNIQTELEGFTCVKT